MKHTSMKPWQRIILFVASSSVVAQSYGQTKITKIFTDFGNFWSSDSARIAGQWSLSSNAKIPNTSHNLLAFRVGNDSVFSTGVNDDLLVSKGLNFTPVNFRALPTVLGNRTSTSYFVGVGSFYGGHWHSAATQPVPQFANPEFYLKDGAQGLDLGTALFNIPNRTVGASAKVPVSFQIDQFNIARIGDNIPDMIVTQMGEPSSGRDTFRFVDVQGNTVGVPKSVSFSGADTLGLAFWAYYNASDGNYVTNQPGNPTNKDRNARAIRVVQWDLNDFGLTANNIGSVVRFEHLLSGDSDPAFVAYNTSSFRALSTFEPGCQTSLKPPIWLQANRGVSANVNNRVGEWKNDGSVAVNAIQTTPAQAPVYRATDLSGTNFRPYLQFGSSNNFMNQNLSPFTTQGNFDIYVVARPTQTTGAHRIVGFQSTAGSSFDFASLWLNSNGQLEFRNDNATALVTGASPGIGKLGVWRISYTRGGKISISLNGGTPVLSSTDHTLSLPTYNTQYGVNGAAFDLAEILFYGNGLSVAERQRIQSYFSVKYGVHYAEDLVSGAGQVIWNRSNGGYVNNIFGIGREDCMGLAQKQSRSTTATTGNDIMQIGLNSITTTNANNTGNIPDAHYIMWGDNGGSLSPTVQVKADKLCLNAPQRTWRAQTTGNLSEELKTQVHIETQGMWSSVGSAGDYYLLIDRNGNGVYDDAVDTAIPATTMQGSTAIFDNVQWDTDDSGADLFTIGLRQASPDAGPDQVATGSGFQMNGSPQNGSWTVERTTPPGAVVTITQPTQHNTQVTVPGGVTATLRWTLDGVGSYCYDEVVLQNQSPLPVQWKYFGLSPKGRQVELRWETGNEQNNRGFFVERSSDGRSFEAIGFVNADESGTYRHLDKEPVPGLNFYRLKQVDRDNGFSYGPVRSIRMDGTGTLQIVPNPVGDKLNILGLNEGAHLVIYAADGRIIYNGSYGNLDIRHWEPGLYLIKAVTDGTVLTSKFVKE